MNRIKSGLKILLGCMIVGTTLNLFFKNLGLVSSGVYGFSLIYSKIVNYPLWLTILLANIIFLTLGYMMIPKKRLVKLIAPTILIPFFTFCTSNINALIDITSADMFMLSIYGGIFMGIGYRFLYKEGFIPNGIDVVNIFFKTTKGHIGNYVGYVFDIIWIIVSGMCFNWNVALYSTIAIVIMEVISKRADLGVSDSKVFYIITKKEKDVKKYIIEELCYDTTEFEVKGGFSRNKNKIIMTVISTKDYYKLREGIKLIDDKAFISITDSYEVINANKELGEFTKID